MRTVFSEIYEWVTSRFCSGTSDKERIKRTIADKPELVEEGLEWIQEDFVKTEYDPNFQFHFFGQDKDGTDVVVMVVPKITHFYNGPHRFMESAFNKNVRRIVVATHIPEDVRNHLEIEGYEWNLVNINSDIEESYFEELRVQICNLIQGTDSS